MSEVLIPKTYRNKIANKLENLELIIDILISNRPQPTPKDKNMYEPIQKNITNIISIFSVFQNHFVSSKSIQQTSSKYVKHQ